MKTIEPKSKDFLTPKQLQEEFGISVGKQSKMRMRKHHNKENAIPFVKLGKTILYKRDEILSWLDNNMINKGLSNE
ncbi:helix-turn-helix domain-containing protein [Campylobacter helveticus]|uniref:helix-turn-helix domain-containing protein n=1 Tax=Campylobacter helveticus TaxID=28898 RepID=UPI00214A5AD8|nr:helix-turn-helix domain-containing protein [Campylobacter helveticus]MCR2056414.1 helix-turn-helix domain-containing protein [Campylobacter helveticus]MCR2061546.1 helix-turn-helix domain-containing protein [Campylobacter helveticus]MCR2066968.1 helix-turn-helix domain-containing protein [Campylobacter helveticus]